VLKLDLLYPKSRFVRREPQRLLRCLHDLHAASESPISVKHGRDLPACSRPQLQQLVRCSVELLHLETRSLPTRSASRHQSFTKRRAECTLPYFPDLTRSQSLGECQYLGFLSASPLSQEGRLMTADPGFHFSPYHERR
jgi:hypothetical protein